MSNSYGFDGSIPEDALYGTYDIENGEWIGRFFFDIETALEEVKDIVHNKVDNDRYGVVSTTDETDWLSEADLSNRRF